MKKLLLCLLAVLGLTAFGWAQRLPETAVPTNYKISFTPNFTNDTFAGDETVQLKVPKATDKIVLNAADITFENVTLTSHGKTQTAKVVTDEKNEMATFTFPSEIPAGDAELHVKYTGILNNKLRGLYLSKTAKRKYAVTQFEATDARRAFPSFDEPDYKATFDISAVVDNGDTAISNSKVEKDTAGPGVGKHTIQFATSPKMSTYLVALLIGDWKCVSDEVDGIPLRVCSVPGKEQMGRIALDETKHIVHYYDQYFGIKYPFGKLDQIAIPDFAAGAMENVGAITYRETLLLADEKTAPDSQKREIASVIAHEIAHQWFGDLVTMKWWDDIWLNEGFATWMSSKPLESWKPEWEINEADVADDSGSMNVDSVKATRPIHQPADTPQEINALFDGIAYGKTAAVLRMIESYVGPETFRAGINRYLQQHEYGNATAADFWNTQTEVSKKPVDKVMSTFVMQPGVPFIDLSSKCEGDKTRVTLSQKRFYFDPTLFNQNSNEPWNIPVCLQGMNAGPNAGATKCELLTAKQQTYTLPSCSSWVFPNANATGYYRYGFDTAALKGASLETSLQPTERISLVSNEWALVRAGWHSVPEYLSLANTLRNDRNTFVLGEIMNRVAYIGRNLVSDQDRPEFQKWVRSFFKPVLNQIGMMPMPGEAPTTTELRGGLYRILGGATGEDADVIAQSKRLTQEYIANPESVPPDLVGAAVFVAASHGDSALYNEFRAKLTQVKTPQEYYTYFYALGYFRDPALLQKTLDFALTDQVRNQDLYIIGDVMSNKHGGPLAWDFVKSHWADLMKKAGGSIGGAGAALGGTGSFCDAKMRDDIRAFYDAHRIPGTERAFRQTQEAIDNCVDLKQRQERPLAEWLQKSTVAAK
jgi:aminopeptidase N/puromycin-sensitive aminopeptidase